MLFDGWKKHLTREMVVDLMDRLSAKALQSTRVIRDHTGLSKLRSAKAEGNLRFHMLEQAFEDVCIQFGGDCIGPVIQGTGLKVYQTYFRYGGTESGMVVGLASMPEPGKLPSQNISRKSAVTLNYFQTPRLALDGKDPSPTDTFVLILVSRDRARAGHLEVMAIGVIDAEFTQFLFYETLDSFLVNITDSPIESVAYPVPADAKPTLKKKIKPFTPPEQDCGDEDDGDDKQATE